MQDLMEIVRCSTMQGQQQQIYSPRCSVNFHRIGGLYLTVLARSDLVIWEQQYTKRHTLQKDAGYTVSETIFILFEQTSQNTT